RGLILLHDTTRLARAFFPRRDAARCFEVRRALPLEIRQDRQDAAVVLGAGRETELAEDAGDVLLDCALGHDHALGDRLVGAALGHQLEHLLLPRREARERILAAAATDH